jgi:hypothetical protein
VELAVEACLADEVLHHKFRHRTATDVAVTNEKYARHDSEFWLQRYAFRGKRPRFSK